AARRTLSHPRSRQTRRFPGKERDSLPLTPANKTEGRKRQKQLKALAALQRTRLLSGSPHGRFQQSVTPVPGAPGTNMVYTCRSNLLASILRYNVSPLLQRQAMKLGSRFLHDWSVPTLAGYCISFLQFVGGYN
ncbi:mCG145281, partial [Mus musculus]